MKQNGAFQGGGPITDISIVTGRDDSNPLATETGPGIPELFGATWPLMMALRNGGCTDDSRHERRRTRSEGPDACS